MPLTQDRMIRVLEAAELMQSRWLMLERTVRDFRRTSADIEQARLLATKARDEKDYGVALQAYESAINGVDSLIDLLRSHQVPTQALLNLTQERAHFNATSRLNDKNKLAQRRLRQRRSTGDAPPIVKQRSTRAQFEAFNRGEITLDDIDRARGDLIDEPNAEVLAASPSPTPSLVDKQLSDAGIEYDPETRARDEARVKNDEALAKYMEEKGVF